MRVEGIEINNLIASMLQDYAYLLKGTLPSSGEDDREKEILIKIPMDVKSEFESQYSIDDLLIGHVSVVGIYKGVVSESFVSANTFSYLQETGAKKNDSTAELSKIIKSDSPIERDSPKTVHHDTEYHFIDVLSIIQDVAFDYETPVVKKLCWLNRLGLWLSRIGR